VAELADALDLGSSPYKGWGFESPLSHESSWNSEAGQRLGLLQHWRSFSLEVRVERQEPWKIALRIRSDSAAVDEEMEKLYVVYARAAEVPGFRKGKAPRELVRARYRKAVQSEAVEKTIPTVYRKAIEQEGINPITQAEIDEVNFEPGKELSFTATFEVVPEFEVKDYEGLPVSGTETPHTREKMSERLELLRQMNASVAPVAREARKGDHIVVDYTVLDADGRHMPEGRVTNYSLPLGEIGQEELDKGLLGARAGDVREMMVSFPPEAKDKRVAGKRLPVRMKIKEVKEKRVPELDDEFAKDLGADSLKDLELRVAGELDEEAQRSRRATLEKEVVDGLIERNPFDPPKSVVDRYMEELRLNSSDLAIWFARRAIILDKLRGVLDLDIQESEIDLRVEKIAGDLKMDSAKMRDKLELTGRIEQLKRSVEREKVLDYLIEHASKT
jgi:trigger factor